MTYDSHVGVELVPVLLWSGIEALWRDTMSAKWKGEREGEGVEHDAKQLRDIGSDVVS